jgi:NAD(P)-dependent dehydrogenase (short-subunit alcohol dehydrogenase family)
MQRPLGTGLGPRTTATEVLADRRLDGRTAVITGGAAGLGRETARVLAAAGATVVVGARNPARARAALVGAPARVVPLDLAEPASIAAFVAAVAAEHQQVDILVNAAGVMATPLARDARGNELQFATNHLGHFSLTVGLLPLLASGARVVSVSSLGHQIAPVDLDDPSFAQRPYDKWQAYGQSKSANALFAVALDQRVPDLTAVSLHPGAIWTGLARHLTDEDLGAMGLLRPDGSRRTTCSDLKTVEEGAATIVWCATSPRLDGHGGAYCEDCDIAEIVDGPEHADRGVRPHAIDPDAAAALWALSERLVAPTP